MSGKEVRVTSATGGQKGQKDAQASTLDAKALLVLAEVAGFGARKYAAHNYLKGYDWSLSFAAMQRHAWSFWSGEDNDPEHGLPHLASVAFHAFALMEFMETHPEFDNRIKGNL